MAQKASKQSLIKDEKQMRITVYFGYALFLLSVISVVVSILPLGRVFTIPGVQYRNIIILLLTLIASSIVPPLVGYFIGERSTHKKSKLIHHYNGVLFGVLGVWISLIFSMIVTYTSWFTYLYTEYTYQFINLIPTLATVVGLVILGIFYTKHTQHQKPLIDYKPYRWLLIGSTIALVLLMGASTFFSSRYSPDVWMSIIISLITPFAMIVAATIIGYIALGERCGTPIERVVKSIVAMSITVVWITILGQLTNYSIELQSLLMLLTIVTGILVWAAYIYLMHRVAR